MRPTLALAVSAACMVTAALPAGAQATAAVSRLVTQYAGSPGASRIDSRLVTGYADLPASSTALSRLITEFAPEPLGTQAVSRLTTSWIGYQLPHAIGALRISAGLQPASAREEDILNVVTSGSSATAIDMLDVFRVLVYVLHPETLP